MANEKICLGDEVKDTVTGFKGIVTGISTFLHGCRRIAVQPKIDKEGKIPEPNWIDEPQLKVVKKKKVSEGKRDTGGPMPSIPTRNTVKRR